MSKNVILDLAHWTHRNMTLDLPMTGGSKEISTSLLHVLYAAYRQLQAETLRSISVTVDTDGSVAFGQHKCPWRLT
jgi:hypothetical protein